MTTSIQPGSAATIAASGEMIRVRGLVQGVGFRPTVWRLARACGLSGDVCNDAGGVLIRAYGQAAARQDFLRRLYDERPPLARIDAVESVQIDTVPPPGFAILPSSGGDIRTGIVADAATCGACHADTADPANRRYRYPFTNCTHCGPRLTLVDAMPYDRANTSMRAFGMCGACLAEYRDPGNRRFHAQPNACAECGPRLWLELTGQRAVADAGDPLDAAQHLLRAGLIVAIKGIGGVHLACDASNEIAVARLRRRKQRISKPFALMARDLAMVRRYCTVSDDEAALLAAKEAPIVLLAARPDASLAPGVAPAQRCLGFMLPYSPLHRLLMDDLATPIVLTSGNRSNEPQCISNDSARQSLAGVADAFLLHDRDIVNRADDSVVRMIAGAPSLLRRARGYAPAPLRLPAGFETAPPILAYGGELKNTFCLLRDGDAMLSQHLGDLENAAASAAFGDTLSLFRQLFDHEPAALAVDSHPEYLPGKRGRDDARTRGLPLHEIQHHHAHIASCMADNGIALDAGPVLGIALDGLGYGDDGTMWGGEFLLADYHGAKRLATLAPVPMPGGVMAIREPWRMAYAHLRRVDDWRVLDPSLAALPFVQRLRGKPVATLEGMIASGLNCPLTSSCGRLFDAVAAVTGICEKASYEGQAAIELESAVDPAALGDDEYAFALEVRNGLLTIEPIPMWQSLLTDLRGNVSPGVVAARFHTGLATALAGTVMRLVGMHGDPWRGRVALSGGVFQNAILCAALSAALEARGMTVMRQVQVPANDGGLSLGQAVVAAAREIATKRSAGVCA